LNPTATAKESKISSWPLITHIKVYKDINLASSGIEVLTYSDTTANYLNTQENTESNRIEKVKIIIVKF